MKLRFILSEDVDIQKHQAQLDAASKRTSIPQEDLINYLNEMDPNGNYTRWILKQIKFQNITVPEDNNRVREVLQQFDQNKQRLEVKDIMQYKRVSDLEDALEPVLGTGSKRKKALQYNPETLPGVEKIAEDGPFVLYHITDADSLAELGEGTKLCTRKSYPDCQAAKYIKYNGPIYIITKNNKLFAQIAVGTREVKDTKNNNIDITDVSTKLIKSVPYLLYLYAIKTGTRIPEVEPYVLADLDRIYSYTKDVIRGRWSEAEQRILGSTPETIAQLGCRYARDVINGRWPEAESYILQDPDSAYTYARDVIKGRWPEAEPTIAKNIDVALRYAVDVVGKRCPILEPSILDSPYLAYKYTVEVVGDRWPEAEPRIKQDPRAAYYYANFVIEGRWPEAEPYIMKHKIWARYYAEIVIKGRWPEAEPTIMKDPKSAYHYAKDVIKRYTDQDRWPEAEPYIMKEPAYAFMYARDAIKGRWPEAEPIIMKDAHAAYYYAVVILRRRWPEAEPIIKQNDEYWSGYKKAFDL